MRHLAALTALGLLASTAAYAQNAQTQPPSGQSQATETHGSQVLSEPFVRQIQMRLRAQGMYEGKPSGSWDEETAKAVQDFQQEHNIQATGQLDGQTLVALMGAPGTEGQGSSTPPMSGGMGMVGMRNPIVRSFERGYQQGFQEGLRWTQQEQEEQ